MSAVNLLSVFLSIDQIRNFIKEKTVPCSQPSCLVNPLKTLASSPGSLPQSIKSFEALFLKRYNSTLNFTEQLSLLFQEFHDHETSHCGRSEDFCLMHFVFPSFFMHICKCSTISQLFPSVNSDYLPILGYSGGQVSLSQQYFRTLLKKSNKQSYCGCPKTFLNHEIPKILIVLTENVVASNFLTFMASVPSSFEANELLEGADQSNYNLFGFLMAEESKIFMFNKVKKLYSWKTGQVGAEKTTSFTEGIKSFIKSGALPIAMIFELAAESFFIESENFLCIENMRIKPRDDLNNLDFVKRCQFFDIWKCSNCQKNNQHVICSCGNSKDYWKCSCGILNKADVCTCKKVRPCCIQCKEIIRTFNVDCRQCGEVICFGDPCQICGIDIRNFCKSCYEKMILCEICGHLNQYGEGLACKRCMNPFIELFQSN